MEDAIKKETCLATNYFMVFSASNATAALFELALYHSILAFFSTAAKKNLCREAWVQDYAYPP